ncbi:hypothetical protein OAG06_05295, partial [Verrucomicrobia bacterium]|nr:hypothetical protein [Verrucomicrobiota bacterium]
MAEQLGTGLVGVQPCVTTRPVFFCAFSSSPSLLFNHSVPSLLFIFSFCLSTLQLLILAHEHIAPFVDGQKLSD